MITLNDLIEILDARLKVVLHYRYGVQFCTSFPHRVYELLTDKHTNNLHLINDIINASEIYNANVVKIMNDGSCVDLYLDFDSKDFD